MTLTEHQKNELDAVADSVAHYIEDHLRETINWQMPDSLVDELHEDSIYGRYGICVRKSITINNRISSITSSGVINRWHGASPIVEVVRDRYELMETKITTRRKIRFMIT